MLGSVAQQLVGAGTAPVLVLRPPARRYPGPAVVPVDPARPRRSIPRHGEAAVGAAAGLARVFRSVVHLAVIVPSFGLRLGRWMLTGRLLPSTTAALLDQSVLDAERLVAKRCAALGKAGVRADARVLRGDPVRMLVRAAGEVDADLVALATHGRSGAGPCSPSGPRGEQVATLARRPLLLVPAPRVRSASRSR